MMTLRGDLVEEEPEEEGDHDGDAGRAVRKKPPALLHEGHLSKLVMGFIAVFA